MLMSFGANPCLARPQTDSSCTVPSRVELNSKSKIVPRQDIAFSLPLMLSRDEATLLLDKGYAKIFDVPKNIPTPSSEEVEKFNELRQVSIVKQIEQLQRMQD